MIGLGLKTLLALGVASLLGTAPAMAHSPYPRPTPVHVGVATPTFHVGFGWGAPAVRRTVDYRMLDRGIALVEEGQALIARGRALERRGHRWAAWHLVRKGERLQYRGQDLVNEGYRLQERARW